MPNLLKQFRELVGTDPLQIGTVVAVFSGGAIVELGGGAQIRVRGEASVSDQVFMRGGVIEGPAPPLTPSVLDI